MISLSFRNIEDGVLFTNNVQEPKGQFFIKIKEVGDERLICKCGIAWNALNVNIHGIF